MSKIKWKNNLGSYIEEGQPNPIRWSILSGNLETGFTQESNWMKCKDFFNDVVYTYNTKKPMQIYGFDTSKLLLPEKGQSLFVAVKDVTSEFVANVHNTTDLSVHEVDGTTVVEISPFYLANTYRISLITLIIRLCNVNTSFGDFEELKACKTFAQKDQVKWNEVVKKNVFFELPEGLSKYVWYAGASYNSETEEGMSSYSIPMNVHNCGVLTYQRFM